MEHLAKKLRTEAAGLPAPLRELLARLAVTARVALIASPVRCLLSAFSDTASCKRRSCKLPRTLDVPYNTSR